MWYLRGILGFTKVFGIAKKVPNNHVKLLSAPLNGAFRQLGNPQPSATSPLYTLGPNKLGGVQPENLYGRTAPNDLSDD